MSFKEEEDEEKEKKEKEEVGEEKDFFRQTTLKYSWDQSFHFPYFRDHCVFFT